MEEKKMKTKWRKTLVVSLVLVMCSVAVLPTVSQSYERAETAKDVEMGSEYIDSICAVEDPDPPTIEYEYFYQDFSSAIQNIELGQPATIHFYMQDVVLQLERNDLIYQDAVIYEEDDGGIIAEHPAPAVAYSGYVISPAGEEAVLVIAENWIEGYAVVGDYYYFDEVIPSESPGYQPYRSWRMEKPTDLNETEGEPDEGICNVQPEGSRMISRLNRLTGMRPENNMNSMPEEGVLSQSGSDAIPLHGWISQRIVVHNDIEFYNLPCPWYLPRWFCAFMRMVSDLNRVYWIYGIQTSVFFSLRAVYICVRGNCGLPSYNAVTLLYQFRDHMLASHRNPRYHVAHLFTGKNLNGGIIGVAFLNSHWALSQQVREPGTTYQATQYQRVILEAHEIGHNYNALHQFAQRWWWFGWYYSIMWTPFMGNRMLPIFSSTNANRIHNNAHTHPLSPP